MQHPNLSSFLGLKEVENGLAILSPLVIGKNLHEHIFGLLKKVGYTKATQNSIIIRGITSMIVSSSRKILH